jgi:hypothetical protein
VQSGTLTYRLREEGAVEMPRRRTEATAGGLLAAWTDADTAMQIVGTNLGVFGAGLLDPDVILSADTPLRNALFDVLLSLVEGGALEMRPADDGRYAFRWRADIATAAVSSDVQQTIDVEAPSPYLEELIRLQRERDDALGRAEFAEALAAERERLLRLASAPLPAERHAPLPGLDPEGQSVLDVLYASHTGKPPARADDPPKPARRKPAPRRKASLPKTRARPASSDVVYLAPATGDEGAEGPRWSGYTLEKPRPRLSTFDRLADEA